MNLLSSQRNVGQPLAAMKFGLLVMAGVLVMTLSAKIQVPFWPVPMTLHTLSVMAFAVLAGPRLAFAIVATYLTVGAAGFPVFSGSPERGIGIAYMMGPTGGYLLGFLIASWLVGRVAAGRSIVGRLGAMLAGLALVYGLGVSWLVMFVPTHQLFAIGVAPFLAGDLLKIAVVAVCASVLPESLSRFQGPRS